MNSISKKLSEKDIDNYLKQNKEYLIKNPRNPHIKYFFKKINETITIFKSGTLLIQKNISSKQQTLTKNYIGCDEVGVGDYFGGLVTCAVYLNKSNEMEIKKLGIRDSKELSDQQMINIFNKLTKLIKYQVGTYTPLQYNDIIKTYQNTHIAKALLHDESIKKLTKEINENVSVVMDAFVQDKNYYKYLNIANIKPYPVDRFETHAENKYLAVACASIIARVTFLKQIADLSKKVQFPLPLGASNPKIISIAKDIYRKGGLELLKQVAKIDFNITKKVVS